MLLSLMVMVVVAHPRKECPSSCSSLSWSWWWWLILSIENLSLVKVGNHIIHLSLHFCLGFFDLSKLGTKVLDSTLSLSESGNKLHLGHFELFSLSNSLRLILSSPQGRITLCLGSLAKNIISGGGFLIKSLPRSINLMLKITELAKQQRSLSSLIISKRLNFFQLGTERRFNLKKHIEIVINISNNTEKVSILSSNFPL